MPLSLALNIPPARADADANDGVVVACPELPEATTAELEARARATLLTTDLSATVAISCVAEAVVVQVNAGGDGVTLKVRVAAATLREEALRALDRALADLGARVKPEGQASELAGAPSTATRPDRSPLGPDVAEAPPLPSAQPPTPPAVPITTETEVGAYFGGEGWGNRPALGGGLRAAVRFDATWSFGVRVGAFHPLGLGAATVVEAQAMVEAAVTARALLGLRFGIGAGPSLLVASPESGFVAPAATPKSAVRLEAQIGRPFRWHKLELTPWVGARAFTAERGVRVAGQPSVIVGGLQPQVGLALSLIH